MTSQPGWHPDPVPPQPGQPPLLRYWDGARWTEHTAPAQTPAATQQYAAPAYPGSYGTAYAGVKPPATTPDGVPLAGWWGRALALIIDGLLVGVVAGIIAFPWARDVFDTYRDWFDEALNADSSTPDTSQLQSDIATSGEILVVDSRLAWFFFHDALKVHLITDATVAARRVLGRPADTVESYASLDEARQRLAERSESERIRFLERYGADKTRLRNYDLVCDTTRATPEEIVSRVVEALGGPGDRPLLYVDPRRVIPGDAAADGPIRLRYARPDFVAVAGRAALERADREGRALVRAALAESTVDAG